MRFVQFLFFRHALEQAKDTISDLTAQQSYLLELED